MSNECYVALTGVDYPKSAIMPRTLGIHPNHMVVMALPQAGSLPSTGTLTLGFGTSYIYTDVYFESYSIQMTTRGHVMMIRLADKRLAWQWRKISGSYNYRLSTGGIVAATQKNMRELAVLLLNAMGETSYDVSVLPTDVYPEVDWSYSTASLELARLIDDLSCDVCLNIDGSVSIVQLGSGEDLPVDTDTQSVSVTAAAPLVPNKIVFVGGETQAEGRYKLAAIGRDTDGELKPINDLSYKPASGWDSVSDIDTFNQVAAEFGEEARKCALDTVFKWWQIVSHIDGTLFVPGYGTIGDMSQILPLNEHLILTAAAPEFSLNQQQPALLMGTFAIQDNLSQLNTSDYTLYPGGFTIDRKNGIVKTSKQVFKYSGGYSVAADLYVQVSHPLRLPSTNQYHRYTQELVLTPGDLTAVVHRDDVTLSVRGVYSSGAPASLVTTEDNSSDVGDEATATLNYAASKFSSPIYAYNRYRSLKPILPDGAIQQIVWIVDCERGANTFASRNSEVFPYIPKSAERRRRRLSETNSDINRRNRIHKRLQINGGGW